MNLLRNILMMAGAIEICVALVHFAMPYFTQQGIGFKSLNPDEIDFINLLILAVGLLLLAFGCFTIFLAKRVESLVEMLFYYLVIKVILWVLRVVLELLYPVKIELFYIDPFTMIVLPGLVFECLLFCVALLLTAQMREVISWEKSA